VSGATCPNCGSASVRMSFSRIGEHGFRVRRRQCQECTSFFSTIELPERLADRALSPSTSDGEVWALRETLDRIRSALDYVPPRDRDELDAAIAADLDAGLSLRQCARKHGVNVGRVRGARARRVPTA
jgi:transcriptional regulator NrdR family protein